MPRLSACQLFFPRVHEGKFSAIRQSIVQFFVAVHEPAFGTKRTCRSRQRMSAFGGKADIGRRSMSAIDIVEHPILP